MKGLQLYRVFINKYFLDLIQLKVRQSQ